MKIGDRAIGPGEPVYVVAEMSANHCGDFNRARAIVRAAKAAGADAVKLQTYMPDTLTIDADGEFFQVKGGTQWDGRTLYNLYGEAYTPWEWHPELRDGASDLGMDFFSTAFDRSAVDFLEELDVEVFKIASFELVDLDLIRRVAQTGKAMIMSTGMATLSEIDEAVRTARDAGATDIALLKCVSAYPARAEDMNLRTIPHLADSFGLPVGISDHSMGIAVPIAAVALGACIVEKHFTLSRSLGGPDAAFSLEPHEFMQMVEGVRVTEKALGTVKYDPTPSEESSRVFRRSLFVVKDVGAGEAFTDENIRSIRPGNGLPPKYKGLVIGRRASRDLARGTPLSWEHVR
ncbi:MAG: pseudaminic acid synthase [Pseudomonadota bacterium]